MKKSVSFFILLCVINITQAQIKKRSDYYRTSVGGKFYPSGITIKQEVAKHQLFEAVFYFFEGARITGLYEFHRRFKNSNSFRWYFGPGFHVQFNDNEASNNGYNYVGLDAVLGIDWKIKNAPLNVSLDWQPSFDFINRDNFKGGFGGLSIRYVIK